MEITIQNYGPIKNCTIVPKPLTVFVGENSTGKSWTASLLANLFGSPMSERYLKSYVKKSVSEEYSDIENAIDKLMEDGNATIDIEVFFENNGLNYLKNIATLTPYHLPDLLSTEKISFENLKIDIDCDLKEHQPFLKDKNVDTKLEKKFGENKEGDPLLHIYKEEGDSKIYLYARSSQELETMPQYLLRENIIRYVFMAIQRSFYPNVYFIPAERTGLIYLLYKINKPTRKNEIVDDEHENDNNKIKLPHTVENLLNMIISSMAMDTTSRMNSAEKDGSIQKYIDYSKILEQDILGGSVGKEKLKDESLEMFFKLEESDGQPFDVPPLSSCIKDLIPLIFYLRFKAQKDDLLILDEPEMNLHPRAQVKLIELLGMMANAGIKLVITTHSPYLVDHISNLTKAKKLEQSGKSGLETKFQLKRKDSFIKKEDVAVYLFENGTTKQIIDDDGIVDWETFGKVSDYVSDLYFDL